MILAGDVGGTHTRLAVFEVRRGRLVLRDRSTAKNAGARDLATIVRAFLNEVRRPVKVACFGVAGPVKDGRARLTNLSWALDERRLARALRLRRVSLINDLVAHAEGINVLRPRDVVTLYRGRPARGGNRVILAPGTGLGEGGLVFDPHANDYRAFASEGGHCDFAPRDDREVALMRFLLTRFGRCDWEHALSGPGLRNLFDFFATPGPYHVKPSLDGQPSPADVAGAALDGTCRASVAAVELFVELCGSEAGNLALKVLATGGVYLGGGIPPKLLKFFRKPALRRAFVRKGPRKIQQVLEAIPIRVILSDDNALFGAAHHARRK